MKVQSWTFIKESRFYTYGRSRSCKWCKLFNDCRFLRHYDNDEWLDNGRCGCVKFKNKYRPNTNEKVL